MTMNNYKINGISYTLQYEENNLIIKALHFKSLAQFKCIIDPKQYFFSQKIKNLAVLEEMLRINFENESLDIFYNKRKQTIKIIMFIDPKNIWDTFEVKLFVDEEPDDEIQIININKKLNSLYNNCMPLIEMINNMQEEINELKLLVVKLQS